MLKKVRHRLINTKTAVTINHLVGRDEIITNKALIYLKKDLEHTIPIEVLVLDKIMEVPREEYPLEEKIPNLNQEYPKPKQNVDILLGITDSMRLLTGKIRKVGNGLYVLSTLYGNIIVGQEGRNFTQLHKMDVPPEIWEAEQERSHVWDNDSAPTDEMDSVAEDSFLSKSETLAKKLDRFYEMDRLPMDSSENEMSVDELLAIERLEENLVYHPKKKRFITKLLFKEKPKIQNNFRQAKQRLDSMLRKLSKNSEHKKLYLNSINEMIELGFLEPVEDQNPGDPNKPIYYLCHRGVFLLDRETTPCRPVFDASCKMPNGLSLNDLILPGPAILNDLRGCALRFRADPIAIQADVSKQFLNIWLHEDQRDYLRILWYDQNGKLLVYRFKTITFGLSDAPIQSVTCLQRLAKMTLEDPKSSEWDIKAAKIILKRFYMDDLLGGAKTVNGALQLIKSLVKILEKGNFKLGKFATNHPEVLKAIPEEHRSKFASVLLDTDPVNDPEIKTKMLGVKWDPKTDTFVFNQFGGLIDDNADTKRSVASILASVYDPISLITPWILQARKVLRQCHKASTPDRWDDPLTENVATAWHKWLSEIKLLHKVTFPRYFPNDKDTDYIIMTDASLEGFGCIAFARTRLANGTFDCNFVTSRSWVSKKDHTTIPRAELCSLLEGCVLGKFLEDQMDVKKSKIRVMTDSIIALYWAKNPKPDSLIPFVSNRVRKIQEHGYKLDFIETNFNSADICSRGCSILELNNELYRKGPKFLRQEESKWPKPSLDFNKINKLEGLKKQYSITTMLTQSMVGCKDLLRYRHSSQPKESEPNLKVHKKQYNKLHEYHNKYLKLIRIVAFMFKFVDKVVRRKSNLKPQPINEFVLENKYIEKAEKYWFKLAQQSCFPEELKALHKNQPVAKNSRLSKYNPILDKDGIIRVGGRISQSSVEETTKHPILLSSEHLLYKYIIEYFHVKLRHQGIEAVHYAIREKIWLLQGRQGVRSVTYNCVTCKRFNAKPLAQQMADLPATVVDKYETPFTYCSVDLTGAIPVRVNNSKRETNYYIVVFCCNQTRLANVELVKDNSASEFILAFRRHGAAFGFPKIMYSDNAGNFIKADKIINRSHDTLNLKTQYKHINENFKEDVEQKYQFKWNFTDPRSAHTGGRHESIIKVTKLALNKTLKGAKLNYCELYTIIKELQALINSRPLYAAQSSEDTLDVLTPNHFLFGKKLTPYVDRASTKDLQEPNKPDLVERWRYRNKILQHLWRRWSSTYLLDLQQRAKWKTLQPSIKVGDVVVVEKPLCKRKDWSLAVVKELLHTKSDGLVRSAKLYTNLKHNDKPFYKYPLNKPYPVKVYRNKRKASLPHTLIIRHLNEIYPLPQHVNPVQLDLSDKQQLPTTNKKPLDDNKIIHKNSGKTHGQPKNSFDMEEIDPEDIIIPKKKLKLYQDKIKNKINNEEDKYQLRSSQKKYIRPSYKKYFKKYKYEDESLGM